MQNNNIREKAFWIQDFFRGSKIKKQYKDIERCMERKKQNEEALKKILQYAIKEIPFYKDIDSNNLLDFPVINKKIYNENYDLLRNKKYSKNLHTVLTSGSTGNPFKAVQNAEKRERTVASLLYFHKKVGFDLGKRYIFLRALSEFNKTSKIKNFMQNYIPIQAIGLNEEGMKKIEKLLDKDKKIKVLIGYGSTLKEVAEYFEKTNKKYKLDAIISGADTLTDETRIKLEKIFQCSVANRYSNEENGMMAITLPGKKEFTLNTANYYFELLKLDSDEPAEKGEIGRIVLTDLYNYAMPFIRYDTGDLAISDDEDRTNLKTFKSLAGRTCDMLEDENGNKIGLVSVNIFVHDFFDIVKFQFVQYNDRVIFKVVSKNNKNDIEKMNEKYIKELKKFLGQSMKIEVQYVDDIPVEKNGKYKAIINKKTNLQNVEDTK